MLKFLCVSLLLMASLNPLYGMFEGDTYERDGTVFSNQNTVFKKEKNYDGSSIKHSPQNVTLCPATVEHLNEEAILHYMYFENLHPTSKVMSFFVTPNRGLTRNSTDFSSLPTAPYASIPVKLNSLHEQIELLIWEEGNRGSRDDYAPAVAGALKIILNDYIPAVYRAGNLPKLQTVKIHDSNRKLEGLVLSHSFASDVKQRFQICNSLPIQPGINDFFEVTFALKK